MRVHGPGGTSDHNRGMKYTLPPAARSLLFTAMLLHSYRKVPRAPAFGMRVRDDSHGNRR